MPDEPCPICSHLLSTGNHFIVPHPNGRVTLICPSFEEFVVDGSRTIEVKLPPSLTAGHD